MNKSERSLMRTKIITLHCLNWSVLKISKFLGINKNTVNLWTKKYDDLKLIEDDSRSGRKRKTTREDDLKIIEIVDETEKKRRIIIR